MQVPQKIRSDVGDGTFSLLFIIKIRHMKKIQEKINKAIAHYGTSSVYHPKMGEENEYLSVPVPEGVDTDDLCNTISRVINGEGLQIDDECISEEIQIIWSFI